jgi:hypothetical protein
LRLATFLEAVGLTYVLIVLTSGNVKVPWGITQTLVAEPVILNASFKASLTARAVFNLKMLVA